MIAKIGDDISEAAELLRNNEIVAIPTETVYGLAANALNRLAVAKIFEAKNRPTFDPLIVHLAHEEDVKKFCLEVPDTFHQLLEAFCPGPITFILKKKSIIPDLVTAGHNTVGIRFPKHPLTQQLITECGLPLAAPSANPFGYVSPTSAQHVAAQLANKIPYILNGGECKIGLESTIVDLSKGKVEVLRFGGLSIEDLEIALGRKVDSVRTSSSNPNAPGMLSSHYSPTKKIIFGDIEVNSQQFQGKKLGAITFNKKLDFILSENQWVLSPKSDLLEAAQNLFRVLRETDKTDFDYILAEEFPNEGLGRAINDRLKRASAS